MSNDYRVIIIRNPNSSDEERAELHLHDVSEGKLAGALVNRIMGQDKLTWFKGIE